MTVSVAGSAPINNTKHISNTVDQCQYQKNDELARAQSNEIVADRPSDLTGPVTYKLPESFNYSLNDIYSILNTDGGPLRQQLSADIRNVIIKKGIELPESESESCIFLCSPEISNKWDQLGVNYGNDYYFLFDLPEPATTNVNTTTDIQIPGHVANIPAAPSTEPEVTIHASNKRLNTVYAEESGMSFNTADTIEINDREISSSISSVSTTYPPQNNPGLSETPDNNQSIYNQRVNDMADMGKRNLKFPMAIMVTGTVAALCGIILGTTKYIGADNADYNKEASDAGDAAVQREVFEDQKNYYDENYQGDKQAIADKYMKSTDANGLDHPIFSADKLTESGQASMVPIRENARNEAADTARNRAKSISYGLFGLGGVGTLMAAIGGGRMAYVKYKNEHIEKLKTDPEAAPGRFVAMTHRFDRGIDTAMNKGGQALTQQGQTLQKATVGLKQTLTKRF
ncbi:hypothetical protein [Serratia quinivorans]|uniref:hypothetical protein n=1 Tax=Serratia quinivorans TaxID=137545 RepID=UPI00217ADA5C|nr:hypothetical protein [Serratia quinivorans]CAI1012010.1 Uncharacterised protein [Serratia quinivorans]CAI1812210.1 Uncharacterised protein [Serratia quinivorans]